MARMLGRMRPPWCPSCRAAPGPDCPDEGKDVRQVRAAEKRDVQAELDALVLDSALSDDDPVQFLLYRSTAKLTKTR